MHKPRKIGRNDPCWCGSGKKFKRCHIAGDRSVPVKPWEVDQIMTAAFSRRECNAPPDIKVDCSSTIVKAHTVQKSTSLSSISEDGHVLGFMSGFQQLVDHGAIEPTKIGVQRASRFGGFCSLHDNKLFSPLEREPFIGTTEQLLLLHFRAVSWELSSKKASASLKPLQIEMSERLPSPQREQAREVTENFHYGVGLGVRDGQAEKDRLDSMLSDGNYESMNGYVIELDELPPIMCTFAFAPEQDFAGNKLQDLPAFESAADYVSVSIFSDGTSGYVVFAWHESEGGYVKKFIDSLHDLSDSELANAIFQLVFEWCENTYVSPAWWSKIDAPVRQSLMERMNTSGSPFNPRDADALVSDGVNYDLWTVVSRGFKNG